MLLRELVVPTMSCRLPKLNIAYVNNYSYQSTLNLPPLVSSDSLSFSHGEDNAQIPPSPSTLYFTDFFWIFRHPFLLQAALSAYAPV